MLNIIDVFSKYAWSVPLKDKKGETTSEAFRRIVKDSGRIPKHIWVDNGLEFYNRHVDAWLRENNIVRYSTYGEHKSAVVERFNRTLKEKMWKRFTAENTRNWIDMLDSLMKDYSTRIHSSIGMSPIEGSLVKNRENVINNSCYRIIPKSKPKYKIDDKVRISRFKGVFERAIYQTGRRRYLLRLRRRSLPLTS